MVASRRVDSKLELNQEKLSALFALLEDHILVQRGNVIPLLPLYALGTSVLIVP